MVALPSMVSLSEWTILCVVPVSSRKLHGRPLMDAAVMLDAVSG